MVKYLDLEQSEGLTSCPRATPASSVNSTSVPHLLIESRLVVKRVCARALKRLLLFSQEVMSNSFATPCTIALQASLSVGFPRQEYRSGLPFPSPGDLSDPGIEPTSPALAGIFLLLSL